ncbi:hypothetical protein [Leifsonia sp. ALI-44-B]|uniref:hypothetical protein n=1 Tax=Leifsonia sp. ALI-44-B TaxID=1933776 RepID=UPI00117AA621|nr:hypothetical protein [Leifsonia sp. ALI-44-B]
MTMVEVNARPGEPGVMDNVRNVLPARAEAESATNGTRAVRARPDHPTALRGVTAMVNAGVVRTTVRTGIGPLAETAPGRVQVGRTVPDVTALVPVAPTANVAGRALAARSATATVRVRDGATEAARVTVGAVSVRMAAVHVTVAVLVTGSAVNVHTVAADVTGNAKSGPTVAARVTVDAVSARTAAADVTVSALEARLVPVVMVSAQGATATVSVPLARAVHETATADHVHLVVLARGNAPSVRSVAAHEGEAESSVAVTVSPVATTGAGAMTRGVPIVRAMVTATVDVGATIVAGGKTPCGLGTGAPRVATAMHVPRKRS